MFTGLIEELAMISKVDRAGEGVGISIKRPASFNDLKTGDSVSVNGVCLTVSGLSGSYMRFDVMRESVERSDLGDLKPGRRVNLERALKAGDRLGGHYVTGHIDYKAKIKNSEKRRNDMVLEITLPEACKRYIAPKGSVAVDGISLTVGRCAGDSFTVYLVPHTIRSTTLGFKGKGDVVNVELDMLGKYVVGLKGKAGVSGINMDFLKQHGFV